jgi:hypothetical protein
LSRTSGSKIRSTAFSPKEVVPPALVPLDPAVLGPPLLGQVGAGEELDAGDDRVVDDAGDHVDVVEHAVDPEPDEGQLPLGLEVDVGGPLLEGVGENLVEGLDHGGGRGVEVGVGLGEKLLVGDVDGGDAALRELLLRVLEARLEVVEALVDALDVAARRHHAIHVEAGDALDVLVGEGREGIVDGDGEAVAGLADRDHAMASGERAGNRLRDHVEVEVEGVDLDVGQPRFVGHGLGDLHLVHDAELDERLLRGELVDLLGAAHALHLLLVHHPLAQEDRQEVRRRGGRGRRCALARGGFGHGPLGRIIRGPRGVVNRGGAALGRRTPREALAR